MRCENSSLTQENERYRHLVETLLRHPALTPFLDDIYKDHSVLAPTQLQQHDTQSVPTQQQGALAQAKHQFASEDDRSKFMAFDASQLNIPRQEQHARDTQHEQLSERLILAMIPKPELGRLNMNDLHLMNFGDQKANAFAIDSSTTGSDPTDIPVA